MIVIERSSLMKPKENKEKCMSGDQSPSKYNIS